MRRRYAFYNESFLNRQQRVDELESENRQQRVDELKMPVFFGQIPWGHHIHRGVVSTRHSEAAWRGNVSVTGSS